MVRLTQVNKLWLILQEKQFRNYIILYHVFSLCTIFKCSRFYCIENYYSIKCLFNGWMISFLLHKILIVQYMAIWLKNCTPNRVIYRLIITLHFALQDFYTLLISIKFLIIKQTLNLSVYLVVIVDAWDVWSIWYLLENNFLTSWLRNWNK